MFKLFFKLGALSLLSFLFISETSAQTDSSSIQNRVTDIYTENSGGVFRVFGAHHTYDEKGDLQNTLKAGTGFFISREGHILANSSVLMNSSRTWIEYKGINYSAELIGVEPSTNLALLKASNLPEDIPFFIPEGNHSLPDVGSLVVMISCPFDFNPSPSLTMIAGAETSFSLREFATTYLRINKSVNIGEGGAPVIDLNGRFIGILVASAPEVRSGYVLPARAVLRIRDDLLFAGKFINGWIGFDVGDRSSISEGRQIYLTEVVAGSPMDKAGMKVGDVLLQMGDFPIREISDVKNSMFFARAGQFLDIQVNRAGQLLDFTVKVSERPSAGPAPSPTTPNDGTQVTQPSGVDSELKQEYEKTPS